MDQTVRKKVDNMCSLTHEIKEQAASERESQIILNMYRKKLPLEQIAEFVDIIVDEVKATVVTQKKPLLS